MKGREGKGREGKGWDGKRKKGKGREGKGMKGEELGGKEQAGWRAYPPIVNCNNLTISGTICIFTSFFCAITLTFVFLPSLSAMSHAHQQPTTTKLHLNLEPRVWNHHPNNLHPSLGANYSLQIAIFTFEFHYIIQILCLILPLTQALNQQPEFCLYTIQSLKQHSLASSSARNQQANSPYITD